MYYYDVVKHCKTWYIQSLKYLEDSRLTQLTSDLTETVLNTRGSRNGSAGISSSVGLVVRGGAGQGGGGGGNNAKGGGGKKKKRPPPSSSPASSRQRAAHAAARGRNASSSAR